MGDPGSGDQVILNNFSFFFVHYQMNDKTHLLDLSNVYGSDAKVARELRTHKKGSLNVTSQIEINSGHPVKPVGLLDFLPYDEASGTGISSCALSKGVTGKEPSAHVKCFKAGEPNSVHKPNHANFPGFHHQSHASPSSYTSH